MLNEWSDRDPGGRPPRWWIYAALIFIAGMTVWGTGARIVASNASAAIAFGGTALHLKASSPCLWESGGMREHQVRTFDFALGRKQPDEIRSIISSLNDESDKTTVAHFAPAGEHEAVAVIFAGNAEKFFMTAAARHLLCPALIIQDPHSYWFQGSDMMPDLDTFCREYLMHVVGRANALFFGQSSGAHAALAASVHFPASTVVACAPQTFDDASIKSLINFVGIRALNTLPGIIDVAARMKAFPDQQSARMVAIAAGEVDNPASAHWWGDFIHMLPLVGCPNVDISVVSQNTHVLAHGKINEFAKLMLTLSENLSHSFERRVDIFHRFLDQQFGAGG